VISLLIFAYWNEKPKPEMALIADCERASCYSFVEDQRKRAAWPSHFAISATPAECQRSHKGPAKK